MRVLVLSVVVILIAGLLSIHAQPAGDLDIVLGEINGEEVLYVRDELLIKPLAGSDIVDIAGDLRATVIDSIPEIRWYRLKLSQDTDALPVYQDIDGTSGVQYCGLHEFFPQPDEGMAGPSGGTRDDPPDEIGWPIEITRADEAWNKLGISPVKIAILDTGVDQIHVEHPDGEFYGQDRIEVGRDWINWTPGGEYDPAWDDDINGHGTHRVGEIAAPWDGHGVAGIVAGSYGDNKQICRVQVEKVADSSAGFSGWVVPAGILYSIQCGARVISLSYSGVKRSSTDFPLLRDTFYFVNDYWHTVVILCCTGNTGELENGRDLPKPWITYPAAWSCDLDCVIAVGSSTHEDAVWSHSEWRQAWYDGHHYHGEVSFLAPGDDPEQEYSYWTTTRAINGEPHWSNMLAGGTSGATAFAAGIAGMMISKFHWLENHEIKERLQNTSTMIPLPSGDHYTEGDCWGHPCWSERAGSGRVDALRSLNLRYFRPSCFAGLGREGFSSLERATEIGAPCDGGAEVSVYDLLGRRLCAFALPDIPRNKASIKAYIESQMQLPGGAKIVRFRSENEVRTWRLAP